MSFKAQKFLIVAMWGQSLHNKFSHQHANGMSIAGGQTESQLVYIGLKPTVLMLTKVFKSTEDSSVLSSPQISLIFYVRLGLYSSAVNSSGLKEQLFSPSSYFISY